ncbi:MAG: Zn-ribbon domain-containing OB-fold protein [Acidimicrobiia bacterium]
MTAADTPVSPRPLPALDIGNRAFWTGGERGELLISRCAECGFWSHPPVPRCPACTSPRVAPQPVSGGGVVYSFTINHHAWYPAMDTPYAVGIVELHEQTGLRLTTTLIGCAPDDVVVGLPVRVSFQRLEDVWLPFFTVDC